MPSVVNIRANSALPHASGQEIMQGSGVILDVKKGIVVTNAHVIDHTHNVTVTLNDGRRFIGHVLGKDRVTDLAVIHIEPDHLSTLPYTESIDVGDFVTAIGSPFGLSQTVTSGIISSTHRHIGIEGIENFIQTDAPINPGNSGGALINKKGQLVGINTAILSKHHGGNIGIGFAIPMTIVIPIVKQLVEFGEVKHGILGIIAQDLTPSLAKALKQPLKKGAIITKILPHSPAAKAGLRAEDIIVKINRHPVKGASDLRSAVGVYRPDTSLHLIIRRNDKFQALKVILKDPKKIKQPKSNFPLAGLRLSSYTELDVYGKTVQGIEVKDVIKGGQAWLSGLHPGDVILSLNKKSVTTLDGLKNIVNHIPKKQHILMKVMRAHSQLLLVLKT